MTGLARQTAALSMATATPAPFCSSQLASLIEFVAGQGRLGEDENPCPLFGSNARKSNVLFDIGVHITRQRDRLGGS